MRTGCATSSGMRKSSCQLRRIKRLTADAKDAAGQRIEFLPQQFVLPTTLH